MAQLDLLQVLQSNIHGGVAFESSLGIILHVDTCEVVTEVDFIPSNFSKFPICKQLENGKEVRPPKKLRPPKELRPRNELRIQSHIVANL